MATITPTVVHKGPRQLTATWAGVTKNDTCSPLQIGNFSDKSIQVEGTPDSGTAVLAGSNDGVNYRTLQDMSDNALSWTVFGIIDSVGGNPKYIRPGVSGGTAPVATFTLHCKNP